MADPNQSGPKGGTGSRAAASRPASNVVIAPELFEPPPHHKAARAVAIGVTTLAVLAAGLFAAVQYRRHGPAVQLLEHGRQELAAGRFDEAVMALRIAHDKGADPDALEPLMQAALAGQRDTAALDQARKALAEHRFDDARVDLQAIPGSSTLHTQAASLAGQIEPARTQFLFGSAREALAQGQLDRARTLQKEVAALEPALGQQLSIDITNAAGAPEVALPTVSLGLDRMGPDPAVRKALASAFKLFDKGDLAGAAKDFAASGSSHPDGTIRAAARALDMAAQTCAQATAASPTSTKDLLTAARACADVDSDGQPVRALRAKLAQAYDAEAQSALKAGHPLAALEAYRTAAAANAADAGSKSGLAGLRAQAPALAEQARKGDPAAKEIWQVLVAVLPPTDALRAEAIQALDK